MGVIAVVVIVGIVAAVWLLARSRVQEPPQSARQVLDECLARGEISSDEYSELRGALAHQVAADSQR